MPILLRTALRTLLRHRAAAVPTSSKSRPTSNISPYFALVSLLFLLSINSKTTSKIPTLSTLSSEHPSTTSITSTSRPPTILIVPAYGGIGNQIYFLLEGLYLARHAHLHLVIPSIPFRKFPTKNLSSTPEEPGHLYWDMNLLQQAVGPNSAVLKELPESCKAQFDAIYFTSRGAIKKKPAQLKVPSRVRQAACFQVRDYDWEDEVPPLNEWECEERLFANTSLERRALPLSFPPRMQFVRELKALRSKQVLAAGGRDMSRPACVIVDGHGFNVGGKLGHEYLYSFMHFLEAGERIRRMASQWNVESLGVLHLRYDERECRSERVNANMVCVRVSMGGDGSSGVYWAHVGELVNVVVRAMNAEGVARIFIAASPYVPRRTVDRLREAFGKRMQVAEEVAGLGHNEGNFVERELAIRAKCFVGDYGSTWSGTVYYKRRTLGKRTLWSSVLLQRARNLGYYGEAKSIPKPEVWERRIVAVSRQVQNESRATGNEATTSQLFS